ncbi:MAG: hypothetical protein WA364_15955 [Candidatus Nitrosopolaris sp.]
MVDNWNTKTTKNFKFTAKFPKEIDKELDYFLKPGSAIEQNIGPNTQTPPPRAPF